MDVNKTEFGDEQIHEVKSILVHLGAVLSWRKCASRKTSEGCDELAEYQVHQRQKHTGRNRCYESNDVECPTFAVRILEDALSPCKPLVSFRVA